jgi:hypothetical protein
MKRLVLFLGLLSLAGLLSCSKNGSGKITAPRLGGAGQWVSASGLDEGTFASVRAFAFNGKMNNMFALVENSGTRVWRSTDNGATWLRAGSGLRNLEIYCMASNGAYLFAGTSEGVFRSANDGASWELGEDAAPQGVDARPWHVTALDVQGTTVFAGGNKNSRNTSDGKFDVQQDGRVYRSTDNGQTWAQVFGGRGNSPGTGGQTNSKVTAIALSGTNLFLGTDRDGVFLHSTTDPDNAAWAPVSATLGNKRVTSLVVHGGALFAGTELYDICDQNGCVDFAGGVYRTLNNGTDWAPAGLETDADRDGVTFTAIGTELFARTSRDVFRYSGGTGWAKQTSPSATATVSALGANGTTLFAGTDGAGVFQSADNGANWTGVGKRNLNTLPVFALAASHDTLFAGTGNGLWRSTDLGATWTNLAVHDANEPFFKLTKVTAIKVVDSHAMPRVSDAARTMWRAAAG